jgi:hypothetical protein
MAYRRARVLLLFCLVSCEPAPQISDLPLALRQLKACQVGEPSALEISALGDFPTETRIISATRPSTPFEPLPSGTRELALLARTEDGRARGRRTLGSAHDADPLWILPEGASCPLGDVLLRATEGTVAVALPAGGALIAGGSDGPTLASADVQLLYDGSEVGAAPAVGMLLRRAHASASVWRDQVVVAGGTPDRRGAAHDTYELFDLAQRRFDAARSGKLTHPRMQHAALVLGDELLIAGGRSEGAGPVLSTVELVDLARRASEELAPANELRVARAEPVLLRLDSGSVLLLAGRDDDGRVLGEVERFDREARRFELLASELPVRAEVVVAALPGARVAWLACDQGPGAVCELWLLAEQGQALSRTPVPLPFAQLASEGLRELALIGTGRGELLLTAADDSDPTGRRRAFSIDPAAPSLARAASSRVPSLLFALSSGAIAELGRDGMSLRAASSAGRYASPEGNVLALQPELLALDAPGHFLREQQGLSALAAARVDLGELRFGELTLELTLEGEGEVLLYDDDSTALTLPLTAAEVQLAGCRAQRPADGKLVVTRSGRALRSAGCTTEAPAGELGVGVRLAQGARLRELRVTRR